MAKILYLYSEVMPYVESVLKVLVEKYNDDVCVISWDKKNLTPYRPNLKSVDYYSRSVLSDDEMMSIAEKFNPNVIYVSGRMDKGYLSIVVDFKKKGVPVVAGMDNQWCGCLKQIIQISLKYFLFKKYFTHIFVPGARQYTLAYFLGFKEKILMNLYSGNTDLFCHIKREYRFKRIVFLGRLEKIKGLDLLLEAWKRINLEKYTDWELVLIGAGSLEVMAKNVENVKTYGFLTQKEIVKVINGDCVFCLPSRKEPWGVVVHEMASAGLPMILSKGVGAGDEFLINGYNGFLLECLSANEIYNKLLQIMNLSVEKRKVMGDNSRNLALRITPEISAASLKSVLL